MTLATQIQLIITCAKAGFKDFVKYGILFAPLADGSTEKAEALSYAAMNNPGCIPLQLGDIQGCHCAVETRAIQRWDNL